MYLLRQLLFRSASAGGSGSKLDNMETQIMLASAAPESPEKDIPPSQPRDPTSFMLAKSCDQDGSDVELTLPAKPKAGLGSTPYGILFLFLKLFHVLKHFSLSMTKQNLFSLRIYLCLIMSNPGTTQDLTSSTCIPTAGLDSSPATRGQEIQEG